MREILRLVGVLTLFCAICAALLAAVYEKTSAPIAAAAAAKRIQAARDVLPAEATELRDTPVGGITNIVAYDATGNFVATAIEGRSSQGYGGEIVLMVGITADGKVRDFKILKAKETPGLGSKIATPKFRGRIQGRALDANWTVRKDGGEIDGITAATISSRAALEAIRDAIAAHQALTAQMAADAAVTPITTTQEEAERP